jgi:hypothetical protein
MSGGGGEIVPERLAGSPVVLWFGSDILELLGVYRREMRRFLSERRASMLNLWGFMAWEGNLETD